MSARRWGVLAATGAVAAVATLIAFAPAALVDVALDRASLGRVRLANATGSVWNGRGTLVLADVPEAGASSAVLSGLAFPGALSWRLRALPLVIGMVDASVAIEPMSEPVRISGNPGEVRVAAGALTLPAVDLSRLGSPWNTIRPSAALGVRWEALTIRNGVLDGRVGIELQDVSSAMTPVRPLGTYRIDVAGTGREVALTLSTISGALQLDGQGSWDRGKGVRFTAQARAEGENRIRLQSLLTLIGRREGDRTIIRIGG